VNNSKACSKCKQIKSPAEFYLDSNTKGLRAACKKCCNLAVNKARAKNPNAYRKQNLDYYYKNKDKLNEERRAKWPEVYQTNIEQQKEKHRRYGQEHPEKIREFARRRRARKRMNGSEPYTEAQVLRIHGTLCHICAGPIDLTKPRKIGSNGWALSLQIDHVIPLAKGGPDTLENVKPAHARCNMAKGDKLFYNDRKERRN
jgi:5-methylcytosine-specific restriction endonuclease McrA